MAYGIASGSKKGPCSNAGLGNCEGCGDFDVFSEAVFLRSGLLWQGIEGFGRVVHAFRFFRLTVRFVTACFFDLTSIANKESDDQCKT